MKNSSLGSFLLGGEVMVIGVFEIMLPPEPPALPSFLGLLVASSKVISPAGIERSDFGSLGGASGYNSEFIPYL
jgi:hypothetical protein